jgi:dTDP-4-amino-4,6-dideoxy-D-galactose acyltransferase
MTSLRLADQHRASELLGLARQHLPHCPLTWLRGADRQALRNIQCAEAFHAAGEREPLVFEHGVGQAGWLLVASRLGWDTRWLGCSVARLDLAMPLAAPFDRPRDPPAEAITVLCGALRERGMQYAFSLVPARHVALVKALGTAGFSLLETRLTYGHDRLAEFTPERRSPVRPAAQAEVQRLGDIAADTVNHFDRFHADEYFDAAAVDRVMREWIDASVNRGFADAVLVPDLGRDPPTAFMTIKYHRERWPAMRVNAAQMVLAAVRRESPGWFYRLVSESALHVRERGATALWATTQATNSATIRVFERLGFRLGECTLVFRRVLAD